MKAFQRYLKRRDGSKGPIFRHQDGSPISRSRLASVLKYHLTLTGRNASHYNTHSFRQGRATDMSKKGYTETQIALAGRWNRKSHGSMSNLTQSIVGHSRVPSTFALGGHSVSLALSGQEQQRWATYTRISVMLRGQATGPKLFHLLSCLRC